MKKITTLVFVLLSFCATAQATDLYDLQNAKRQQIPNLDALLTKHFNQYGVAKPGDTLSLAAFKNKAREAQFHQINRILGLAIDEDHSLQALESLGLMLTKEGSYKINLHENPRWATTSDLAIPLVGGLSYGVKRALISRGFSEDDISKLKQHLNNNPQDIATLQAQLDFIANKSKPFANQSGRLPDIGESMGLLKQYHKIRFETEQDWLLAIFDLFDKQRQRILLSYLQERLGTKVIGKAPLTKQHVIDFGESFVSGKHIKQIQSIIKSRTQEISQ